jgi:hypothetical protein
MLVEFDNSGTTPLWPGEINLEEFDVDLCAVRSVVTGTWNRFKPLSF